MFFSWGNNTGHSPSEGHSFSLANYQGSEGASVQTDLPPERDCATAMLGAPARLPSKDDYQELVDNTTHQWLRLNGRLGLLFTSLNNGRTLFIPAAGYISETAYTELDVHGYFWTKSIHGDGDAYCFGFTSGNLNTGSYIYRYLGLTARAVMDSNPNRSIVSLTSLNEPIEEETPTTEEPKEEETPTTEEPKDDNQR